MFSCLLEPSEHIFFPLSRVSVPSVCVCVCVCLSVSALTAEPFDIQTQNLVEALTLIIFRMSSKVKVKGQGRQVEKRDFRSFR